MQKLTGGSNLIFDYVSGILHVCNKITMIHGGSYIDFESKSKKRLWLQVFLVYNNGCTKPWTGWKRSTEKKKAISLYKPVWVEKHFPAQAKH